MNHITNKCLFFRKIFSCWKFNHINDWIIKYSIISQCRYVLSIFFFLVQYYLLSFYFLSEIFFFFQIPLQYLSLFLHLCIDSQFQFHFLDLQNFLPYQHSHFHRLPHLFLISSLVSFLISFLVSFLISFLIFFLISFFASIIIISLIL